jgi:hypothetical protein
MYREPVILSGMKARISKADRRWIRSSLIS